MKRYRILALVVVFVLVAGFIVLGRSQVSAQTVNVQVTPHRRPKIIAKIQITGEPVIVFDHSTDKQPLRLISGHYEVCQFRAP